MKRNRPLARGAFLCLQIVTSFTSHEKGGTEEVIYKFEEVTDLVPPI